MTETWKPVLGYEDLYEVSDMGRVRRLPHTVAKRGTSRGLPVKGRILTPCFTRKGYKAVGLSRNGKSKTCRVHTLVLEAFVCKRPEGYQTRHLNGNCTDNSLSNLAWGTHEENVEDRRRHGTDAFGERVNNAKLNDQLVREILASPESARAMARRLGVMPSTINNVRNGTRWKHVPRNISEAA